MAAPVDVNAAPISWREAGTGDAVLFLHGLGLTRTSWDRQLVGLGDRWRCVAWDMPGYGRSKPIEPLTFEAIADAAAGLLDTIDIERAHVCGLSFGGQQALHLALRHPDRVASLALADTSAAFGRDGTDADAWRQARLEPLERGLKPADMARDVLCGVAAPGFGGAALEDGVRSFGRITAEGLRGAVRCLPSHDVTDRLGDIEAPALVIVGELDRETPRSYSEELVAGIASAELVELSAVGHLTPLEAPDRFNASLRAFFAARTTLRP